MDVLIEYSLLAIALYVGAGALYVNFCFGNFHQFMSMVLNNDSYVRRCLEQETQPASASYLAFLKIVWLTTYYVIFAWPVVYVWSVKK